MDHYDIVIATPGRSMEAEYVQSLVKTCEWLSSVRMSYKYVNRYSSMVSSAREKTATQTDEHDWETTEFGRGEYTYDWFLWVDSDISWDPADLAELIRSDKDVVSGCVPVNLGGALAAMRLDDEGYPVQLTWNDLALDYEPVLVDGVGFGFMLVRYGVFEKMKRPWFKHRDIRIRGVEFPVMAGEDYSWCLEAKRVGFDIYIHPGVRVGHSKEIVMRL